MTWRTIILNQYWIDRSKYNQIANYAYTQAGIGIKIGNKPLNVYFGAAENNVRAKRSSTAASATLTLQADLAAYCIPETVFDMGVEHYDNFLQQRRRLIAAKIQVYYTAL
jgi:hypothetical protein